MANDLTAARSAAIRAILRPYDPRFPAEPLVSWTTPMLRAEKLLRDAGEDLEFRRDADALDKLHEHLREVRRLIAFVQNRRAG